MSLTFTKTTLGCPDETTGESTQQQEEEDARSVTFTKFLQTVFIVKLFQ